MGGRETVSGKVKEGEIVFKVSGDGGECKAAREGGERKGRGLMRVGVPRLRVWHPERNHVPHPRKFLVNWGCPMVWGCPCGLARTHQEYAWPLVT